MANYTNHLNEDLRKIVDQFVIETQGRYSDCISDTFLSVYLSMNLVDECQTQLHLERKFKVSNLAYQVAVILFEVYMEYGCKFNTNGHHAAQKFASYFDNFEFSQKYVKKSEEKLGS